MYCYEATAYPEIFSKVYWGHFKSIDTDIIQNRNDFVKEYDIQRVNKKLPIILNNPSFCSSKYDHFEMYETRSGGCVVITSPYGALEECVKFGFREIEKLYSKNAYTYCIELKNPTEMQKFNRTVLRYVIGKYPYQHASFKIKSFYSANCVKRTFGCAIKQLENQLIDDEKNDAAVIIQRHLREAMYNPKFLLCRKIMSTLFTKESGGTPLSHTISF